MSTSKAEIAKRLKQARNQLNITQEAFAEPINLLWNNVKDLEAGKKNLTHELALVIEKVHGIDFRWLLTGEGEMFAEEKKGAQMVNVMGGSNSIPIGQLNGSGNNLSIMPQDLPVSECGNRQSIIFERGEGSNKVRMILPPTLETYTFLREQADLRQS